LVSGYGFDAEGEKIPRVKILLLLLRLGIIGCCWSCGVVCGGGGGGGGGGGILGGGD